MKLPRRIYTTLCKATAVTVASIGLILVAGAGTAQANGAGAGIVNSPHDFSAETWNFRGEICRTCHVPHDHNRTAQLFLNGLLWNHQVSSATYTMYDAAWSETLNNPQSAQPDGTAKLCLGCHDGTVGLNQFDSQFGAVGTDFIQDYDPGFQIPGALNAGDLRGTHPLSITYNGTDTGLNPDTTTMGTSGTIADVLDNGKVQCSSCHDVHDGPEAVPNSHLLRVAQTTAQLGNPSGLCLTCHNK